jgi:hypothetical protein
MFFSTSPPSPKPSSRKSNVFIGTKYVLTGGGLSCEHWGALGKVRLRSPVFALLVAKAFH